jgi:hypothetical protein
MLTWRSWPSVPCPAPPLLLLVSRAALEGESSAAGAPATHGLCVRAADHNTNKAKPHTFYCKDRETLFILPAFRTRVVKEWPHPTFAASTVFKEVARPTLQSYPLFSRSLPGADIPSGAGQRRREAASARPGHHPLHHRPQRPSGGRRQNDWKHTGASQGWTQDAKVV